MSQAHYLTCSWFIASWECTDLVVAILHVPMGRGNPRRPVCKTHLDAWLDWSDGKRFGTLWPEPIKIEWTWDAGTRTCLIHRWAAVLCEDWLEHPVVSRGPDSYSSLARRLIDPTAGGRT